MKICTYREGIKANFYIQSKGNYSGRPLKNPIANCFAVQTNTPLAFQICYCLFKMRVYEPFIHGTAVPFINLKDVQNIIQEAFSKTYCEKKLKAIEQIQELITIELKRIDNLKELEYTLSHKTYHEIKS